MSTRPGGESRRYAFPPLWLVPIVLIAGIGLVVWVSLSLGALGLVAGLVLVARLQRRADAFVRARDASADEPA